MFYASMPIVIYAIFDKEFSDEVLINKPSLYVQGMEGFIYLYNKKFKIK